MTFDIYQADILDWAKNYDGLPFDAILCDPPYELGFMGKSWDNTGIAFNVEMWTSLYNILKPGGYLLAFSGTRTYHRMTCAIEDAGFEIRDMIEWMYGSGFPKSLNIGKAVDKIQGNEREVTGTEKVDIGMQGGSMHSGRSVNVVERETTKGTSVFEGYGTALKPAHEPCVLARKPLAESTVAKNVLEYGTGGLNIDGSRIEYEEGGTKATNPTLRTDNGDNSKDYGKSPMFAREKALLVNNPTGRFPANLIHDGSPEVLEHFPESKSTPWPDRASTGCFQASDVVYGGGIGDSGSASRFFYCAKASKAERNAGLDGFEVRDSNYRTEYRPTASDSGDKGQDTPFAGSNRSGNIQNHHPTVKPITLTKYLANLIKPPKNAKLLVPFSGSGSEMIGGLLAGYDHVTGVELTEEYIPIAQARCRWWLDHPNAIYEIPKDEIPPSGDQLKMF